MKKKLLLTLKILGGICLALVVLFIIALALVNTNYVQQKVLTYATTTLTEQLKTQVSIEEADIDLFNMSVRLHGLEVEDLQKRKMLQMKELAAKLQLFALLHNELIIDNASIEGLNALLTKKTDSIPANYQFVIDAFKKDKSQQTTDEGKKKKKKLTFDASYISLKDIHVIYDKYDLKLQEAELNKTLFGHYELTIDSLRADWIAQKKKGPVVTWAAIGKLTATEKDSIVSAKIEGLRFHTKGEKPRKNTGKPKRGFFDVDHFDITSNLKLTIDPTNKDSVKIQLTECTAQDSITGIDIRDLHTDVTFSKGKLFFQDLKLQQKNTVLNIANAVMQLPSKKDSIKLSYSTGTITGKALLTDISRTFAPVLGKFTIPLDLSLTMNGTDSTISFRNVRVNTEDKGLTIAAIGDIKHLKEKELLDVRFKVSSMKAKSNTVEKIINQFPVKKMMMKQLRRLGDISYTGDFAVLYKKEVFQGLLHTAAGNINFNFALDENNKYVSGHASTPRLAIGQVMDIKHLGDVAASATFSIDISKPRTAAMRKKLGGKLPIGTVDAKVDDSSFKGIHVRDTKVSIKSDGAVANGSLRKNGSVGDLWFDFTFTDTNEMSKMKIKHPGLKVHWPWESKDPAVQAEKKRKKEEEKKKKAEEKKKKKEEEEKSGKKKKKFLLF